MDPVGPVAIAYSFCSFGNRRPRPSGTPSNLEGDVHGAVHTISTTPPDLPYRRGGVLGGATQRLWLPLLTLGYLF